jgi:flagellum-specific peptidoglycan hydrolase FlgJ
MTPYQISALAQIAELSVQCEAATQFPAEISAAQCIQESGWLKVAPGNNCFGIKCVAGQPGEAEATHEYVKGERLAVEAIFATYPSLLDCFTAHAKLLQAGRYLPAWQRYQADHNLDRLIVGIAAAGYSTDAAYVSEVTRIAHEAPVTAALAKARAARRAAQVELAAATAPATPATPTAAGGQAPAGGTSTT